jgi:hypothetical protein
MKFFTAAIIYIIAWFVFATFDFRGSDTIVAYTLHPTYGKPKGLPEMIYSTPTVYRISGQIVVGQISEFEPSRYSDCAVIDTENWTCTYSDKSAKFGFSNGDYYNKTLKPFSSSLIKRTPVSRFAWIWNRVEWNFASKDWLQKSLNLFLPFFI